MKKRSRYYLAILLLSVFGFSALHAQKLSYVQGDVMIQVPSDTDVHKLSRELQYFDGNFTKLRVIKRISEHVNIWLLHFDFTRIDEKRFLAYLRAQPSIDIAQFNHIIEEYRQMIPNDPQFMDQWQYINTGANGGTVGADIDMDLAWDITTGGLTTDGDTIVVCVVDSGWDFSHEDMQENLFINRAEIPDNGIDDDGNGFLDDYFGWDTGSNDDNIGVTFNDHGVSVAGIVGAVGNNNIGVAGVNWNVKIMVVAGGTGVESEVLEAYSYPLGFRKKYNETNGAEGAFVVATNSSWGINQGQPADAPLWCAFYDTLGYHGILSAGATANANFDIDAVSDLPTGCPSDFMISVTNMNRNDVKVTGAGYGTNTIDLGAFGAQTWTVEGNNGYGGFGGTSGATPHVAGAIALLYSAPCSNLTALAKADPKEAALLVRQYIFDGVDPNQSLEGITVTGGRLNVYNSLQLVLENCGPCPQPFALDVTDITDVAAQVSWGVPDSATAVTMRWRAIGATDWNTMNNATSPMSLDALTACTNYEIQLETICPDTTSGFSVSYPFQTDGCCISPDDLAFTDLTNDGINFNWSSILAATAYNLRYREQGTMAWTEVTGITGTSVALENLTDCTIYEAQIQTVCVTGAVDYAPLVSFQTFGCGACTDLPYCEIDGSTQYEYIDAITIHTLVNNSGNNDGYGDFTGSSTDVETNNTYDVSLTVAFPGFSENVNWKIWIDYDQNGNFDEPGEIAFETETGSDETITGTISIPGNALTGLTRMRVGMIWNSGGNTNAKPEPCATGYDGEYEDYCINIMPGVPSCDPPLGLNVTDINLTEATLSWNGIGLANSYALQYRTVGATDWIDQNVTDLSTTLSNLMGCSDYEFQVASVCDNEVSPYSTTYVFSTECECNIPLNIDTTEVGENYAVITWGGSMFGTITFNLRYKEPTSVTWTTVTIPGPDYQIDNLIDCRDYQYQIRTNCPNMNSDYSATKTFKTDCAVSVAQDPSLSDLSIFPNPFQNSLSINFDLKAASAIDIEIINVAGQVMYRNFTTIATTGQQSIQLDQLDGLTSGIYFLKIKTDQGTSLRKLVRTNSSK